jgi:hypothetical protein
MDLSEYKKWMGVVVAHVVVLLIVLLVVWVPEFLNGISSKFHVMDQDVTYTAGTPFGKQDPYWWGTLVGVLSVTLILSGHKFYKLYKLQKNTADSISFEES